MSEPERDESFVLWIDRHRSQSGELTGRVEQMRGSGRIAFASTGERLRFLERGTLAQQTAGADALEALSGSGSIRQGG